jgi:hypothetical protein
VLLSGFLGKKGYTGADRGHRGELGIRKTARSRKGPPLPNLALLKARYSKIPVGFIKLTIILMEMRRMMTFQSIPNWSV